MKAARNIAGIDAVVCDKLDARLLAPGAHAGRLAVFTKASLEKIEEHYR
ncbi:MAG: hypothetical protein HZB67_05325 [Candidatus Aenigmarchaeota archaeon]|nr:hypothetical protein [Candidatus Aenigmarchaeota archaeon]